MEKTSDIKAIMARLQASGLSATESPSEPPAPGEPPGRLKTSLHPTLSAGGARKPAVESFSGNLPPKPSAVKHMQSSNAHASGNDTNKTKALADRFQGDGRNRPVIPNRLHPKPNSHEIKDTPKPFCKPSPSPFSSELKSAFPQPSWVKNNNGTSTSLISPQPSIPETNHISRAWKQSEEKPDPDAPKTFAPPQNTLFKSPYAPRSLQSHLTREKETTDEPLNVAEGNKTFPPLAPVPPPVPAPSKKPSMKIKSSFLHDSGPKQKALPHPSTLGLPPIKPYRPPNVNLEMFREAETFKGLKNASSLGKHGSQIRSGQEAPPNLPLRHPEPTIQQDEIYDDVDGNTPPPLPPMTGHPSQGAKTQSDDDGDLYEDLEGQREESERNEKEEKKRLEAERKEEKERQKKEQDARKKFRLVGPLTVIQQVKAVLDSKGSKTDLTLKHGDSLDIIRIQGNPEAKWLARNQEGSIGYVKTTSVDIDFKSLKALQAQQAFEPEVYDDIESSSDNSAFKGSGGSVPASPSEDGDIYDDVDDPKLRSPAPPPGRDGISDQRGAAVTEETYDDVESHRPPVLPPISSIPTLRNKSKSDETELKRQKKFEKEEKEFKKKFRYEGEIQVLYQVTVQPAISNRKGSGKDLSIKGGETLDVIVKPVDNKMICRNAEGKFGYVSTLNILTDDGDIYDDVGEDCIYDNE